MLVAEHNDHALASDKLGKLPLRDRGFSLGTPLQKYVDRHGEAEIAHGDVHSPVPDFIIWRFVQKRRQASSTHSTRSIAAEQLRNEPRAVSLIKPVTNVVIAP